MPHLRFAPARCSVLLGTSFRSFVLLLTLITSALIVTTPLYAAGTIYIVPGNANGAGDIYGDDYIQTQLNSGNYTLDTDTATSGAEDIHIAPGVVITWTSGFSLTLVADANIVVSGTIQHNGPVNSSGGVVLQADDDDTDGGDVLLGLGTQPNAIEVGSRYGMTRVDGSSVRLTAANSGDGLHTQLGYFDINPLAVISTTGPISVSASLTVSAFGGGGLYNYAQIGHGGVVAYITSNGSFFGDIDVYSAGDIVGLGGSGEFAYIQIGNGAAFGDAAYGGSHSLFATNNISITGGTGGESYVQVGNGGLVTGVDGIKEQSGSHRLVAQNGNIAFAAGVGDSSSAIVGNGGTQSVLNASGDHSLVAGQDILFTSGNDIYGFAQIGNGANSNGGYISGDLSVIAGRNIVFDGTGSSDASYVQIGHGGKNFKIAASNPQTVTGNIEVIAQTGYVSFTGGSYDDADAQVGHRVDRGSIDGSIVVTAAQSIYFAAGSSTEAYTQLGHKSSGGAQGGNCLGAITVSAGGDITFLAGIEQAYALLGHGVLDNGWFLEGDISVTTGGDASFTAGSGEGAFAQVGHAPMAGGTAPFGNISILAPEGDILFTGGTSGATYALAGHGGTYDYTLGGASEHNLLAGGKVLFVAGNGEEAFAQAGNTGVSAFGNSNNLTITTLSGAISFLATSGGLDAYAMAGNGGENGIISPLIGNVTLNAATDVIFTAGNSNETFVMAGNGGMAPLVPITGSVVITAGGSISFTAGSGEFSLAQIGNGGYQFNATYAGDHRITAGANIAFRGGSGKGAYAMVGNGGYNGNDSQSGLANHSGSHQLIAGGSIRFTAGSNAYAFAQVGNGGVLIRGNHTGDMSLTAENGDILFTAGTSLNTYAQVGNGGASAEGNHSGSHQLTAGGAVRFIAGNALYAYAQAGNGGSSGEHSGDLTVTAGSGDIVFSAGTNLGTYAQLGNGGASADGNNTGDITVISAQGDILFTSGTSTYAFAQLGNGGSSSVGQQNGDLTVEAPNGDVVFLAQNGTLAYVMVGNGGYDAFGSGFDHSGDLTVEAGGAITFTAGMHLSAFAQIGNGGAASAGNNTGQITVTAGSGNVAFTAKSAYAQIGNGGYNASGDDSGDITVTSAQGDVGFTGGTSIASYVQVGNGGNAAEGQHDGKLKVAAPNGDVVFLGGRTIGAYGMVGNGGYQADSGGTSNHFGDLTVEAGGSITFTAGIAQATFAQVGNGGAFTEGNHSGQITVTAGSGDVVFTAGTASNTYVQIGNGGDDASGNHTGDITVTSAQGDIRFTSSNSTAVYAQIGNGGHGTAGQHDGDVTVEAPNGDVVFLGNSGTESYVMVGNGGYQSDGTGSNDFGDLTVEAGGSITFTAGGGGQFAYAQVGNGGALTEGNHSGQITVTAGSGDVVFTSMQSGAYAQIGHGGRLAYGNHTGDITVTSAQGDIRFTGANSNYGYAQIGHGGHSAEGQHQGNIKTSAPNGDIVFLARVSTESYVMIGNGGYQAEAFGLGDRGDLTVEAGGSITFTAGGSQSAFAQIGNGGGLADGDHTGQITVTAGSGDVVFTTGSAQRTYAQIGNGGSIAEGDFTGDITVRSAQGDVRFTGGNANYNYAQIGNGGHTANGQHEGDIQVNAPNGDIVFLGRLSLEAYVMIGNGGYLLDDSILGAHGDLTVDAGGSITFTAGSGQSAFAQIGNGGGLTDGDHSGQITVTAGSGDVVFTTGTGLRTYAQIGNGGDTAAGSHSGDITVRSAQGDIRLTGGSSSSSYAQIGNGGNVAAGNHEGNLWVEATHGDLVLRAGSASGTYAMVGNGGTEADATTGHIGNMTLWASGSVTVTASASAVATNAFAQVGNGGYGAEGDHTGDITVTVQSGNIAFTAGPAIYSYAQLGNGGGIAPGNQGGKITAIAEQGDLLLSVGSSLTSYAQIGHGDSKANSGGTRSGDIIVLTGDDLMMTGSRIGHVTSNGVNAITDANTYIGVGQSNPSPLGNGIISATNTTTFTASFNSAPLGNDGELRFYVPNKNSALIPINAPMNSELFPGTIPLARTAGYFLFADGPYIQDYSFYLNPPSDVGLIKSVLPSGNLLPGQPVTFTLTFSNSGLYTATQVTLTDTLPSQLENVTVSSAGVAITQTGSAPNLAWTISDLVPNAGGIITVNATIDTALSAATTITNHAAIASSTDITPTNNSASVNASLVPPLAGWSPTAYTVLENVGSVVVTVTLNAPNPYHSLQVNYTTANNSATAGSDYSTQSGALTIPAGQSSVTLTVPILNDSVFETSESFTVTLTSATGASLGANAQAAITILDDDSTLSIAALDADKAEGNSGTTAFTFTVSRTGYVTSTVTVDYAVSGVANGVDFDGSVFPSGTVTFTSGDASEIITATVVGDTILEANEAFTVTLSNSSANATITSATAAGSIDNDDSASVSIDDVSSIEGNSGTTLITLTVTLSGTTDTPFTVDFATANGSATAGSDYTAQANTLSFSGNNGESKTVSVQVTGDSVLESDETFTVTLSNLQGSPVTIADSSGQATVVNDDSALAITALDADKAEGNSGTKPFTFSVNRTGYLTGTVTVDYETSGAVNGTDFAGNLLPSGTVTLTTGVTSQTITATVAGDTLLETNEPFTVTLSNPALGATISGATAAGSVDNDDSASLSINDASTFEGNSGTTLVTLTVTLSGTTDSSFTVDFATADGSATVGSDYTAQNNTLSFAGTDGESKSIVVQVAGDVTLESDEAFNVTLNNVQGLPVSLADAGGQITIVNDDSELAIAALDADKAEGNSGDTDYTFIVTRTGYLTASVTVDYASSGAASGADFDGSVLPNGTVTFNSGDVSQVITATVVGDLVLEADEPFTVTLTNASANASITGATAAGSIDNDDTAGLRINDANAFEGNSGTTLVTLTVMLSGTADSSFTVDFATADNSATAGSDYTAQNNTLTFAGTDGETHNVVVQVAGDSALESDETLVVELSNVQGLPITLADANGQITIVNDDSTLSIVALDADNGEGNSGPTPFTFAVNRTGYLSRTVTVDFATSGAANGADFVDNALPSGTITFNSGASSQIVTATVQGDLLAEGDDNFTVTLSNAAAGASIATAAAVGVIRNDDLAPELTVSKMANVALARVGETITYTYRITNSGGLTFTALSAVDNLLGSVPLDKSSLALDEVATGQLTYTVQSSDLNGPLVNTVTVTGTPLVGNDVVVTKDASVELVFAAFSFAKTVGIEGITPECSATSNMQVPISTTIVYCFTLTNTGAITLTTHTLEDSQLGTVLDGVNVEVAPGASYSTIMTRTIYATVTNTAVWQAGYPGSSVDVATADATTVEADTVSIAALPVQNTTQATITISDADDDQDGDGIPDNTELAGDVDNDNRPNFLDDDSDGDGRLDSTECAALPCRDSNEDGVPDFLDPNDATGIDPDQQPRTPGHIFLPQIGHES